jgi:hypothetical protein
MYKVFYRYVMQKFYIKYLLHGKTQALRTLRSMTGLGFRSYSRDSDWSYTGLVNLASKLVTDLESQEIVLNCSVHLECYPSEAPDEA